MPWRTPRTRRLVPFIPQRGARVAELSLSESRELTELRSLLEPACIGHAVTHGTPEWRRALSAAASELAAKLGARRHVVAASENAYRDFYAALTSTCDSARLRRYTTSVRDQHARYRAATLGSIDRKPLAEQLAGVAEAALDGQPDEASAAACTEIELFATAYEESAAS